jgi:CarD family transcriptional regulator
VFKCGDKVVCPPHGAARVEDIQEKWVLGERRRYFIIKPFYGQMTIMIPVERTSKVGVRRVVEPEEIGSVLKVLSSDGAPLSDNWNHRFKENWGKISSGDIKRIAEVVRDLSHIKSRKSLSTKEKDMLIYARRMLISELVFAQGVDEGEATRVIDGAIKI